MPKAIFGAVAMMAFLALGVSAQGHDHGAQAQSTDTTQAAGSSQSMMQQRMQQMQQRMQQMMQQGGMQGMQEGGMQMGQSQGGMQGMEGMGAQQQARARDGSCLASSQQAGLSALLLGSTADLALTDEQRAELETILARAQRDALDALTSEQREQLESAAPATPAACPRTTTTTPSTN